MVYKQYHAKDRLRGVIMKDLKNETTINYVGKIDVTKIYEDATPIANKIIEFLANEDIDFYTAEKAVELARNGIKTLKLKNYNLRRL